MNNSVSIRNLSPTHLAIVPITGVQNITEAFQTLLKWAGPKGLLIENEYKVLMVYHDSFKNTAPDKVRMSAGLRLVDSMSKDGEIEPLTLPGGKHIVGTFEIPTQAFGQYWEELFKWMNENGYEKANADPFEIYHNDFNKHPQKLCLVNFCIPING
ncbi:MAG: GyrI-like domain-containing protein [Cyclobacteriaceae bacterium]